MIFIKRFFKLFLFVFVVVFAFVIVYSSCSICAFWIDRHTILNKLQVPIPKYSSVVMLGNSPMGYNVYVFNGIKGWKNEYNPIWHECKVKFGQDVRFDTSYRKYISDSTAKIFLKSLEKLTVVYIKKNENIYMIILSVGSGPANNVATKIHQLNQICSSIGA